MANTTTTISVSAYGIPDGGYPNLTVIVDGRPVGAQIVTGTLATYSFPVSLDLSAAHDIQIGFYNTNGQRTLILKSISVGGVVVQATDARETYTSRVGTVTGSGNLQYGGVADFRLPAGSLTGAISPTSPTPPSTPVSSTPAPTPTAPPAPTPAPSSSGTSGSNVITVSAHGIADSNGTFPAFSLIVDGSPVGQQQTITGTNATYSFNDALSSTSAHTVQIGFYNTNGTRAVELNSITVNGTTYLATDPSETYSSRVGVVHGSGDMQYGGVATFTIPAAATTSTPTSTTATTPPASSTSSSGSTSSTPTSTTTTPPPTTPSPSTPSPSMGAFYVATNGSDSGDGSFAHPFATLEHALAAMKQSAIHTTYVEGGNYTLNSTLSLSQSESGFTIAGYNGQKPIISSTLATMVSLTNASNVTLSGLGFKPNGNTAIMLSGGGSNSITGNLVQGGGIAITLAGSSNNTLSGNEIDNSGFAGIELKDGSNNNLVDSNVINGVASSGTQGGGIYAHGVANTVVTHNLVENMAGTGISFANFDQSTTINVGNTVSYNEVINTGTATSYDTGAIYVLGRANVDTKMVISNNYIDKTGAGGNAHTIAIYLDDDADGVTVTNNIARDVGTHAVELHNGHNDTISNNIFDLDTTTNSVAFIQTVPEGPANNMYGDNITQNIIIAHKAAQNGYDEYDGGVASISRNLYYSAVGGQITTSGTASDTNPVFGDPKFVNEPAGNYALASGSAASLIGFKAIDQSGIGPHAATATWYS